VNQGQHEPEEVQIGLRHSFVNALHFFAGLQPSSLDALAPRGTLILTSPHLIRPTLQRVRIEDRFFLLVFLRSLSSPILPIPPRPLHRLARHLSSL
jgi:hypothetical protein